MGKIKKEKGIKAEKVELVDYDDEDEQEQTSVNNHQGHDQDQEMKNNDDDDDNDVKPEMIDPQQLTSLSYHKKIAYVSPIAQPLAPKKLAKKLFKLIKKANKISRKTLLRVGLKDVQTRIRKGETGLVVFAGDVTPIDVMCHLPSVCEEKRIPYAYVPLRHDLSAAVGVRRPTLVVMIKQNDQYDDLYKECTTQIAELPLPY